MKLLKQDVNFGTKHLQHDNSVTTIQLSPEQTKQLRDGERYEDILTGKEQVTVEPYKRVYTNVWKKPPSDFDMSFEQYQELRLDMTDKEILRKLNISSVTLTKFKRKWGLIE